MRIVRWLTLGVSAIAILTAQSFPHIDDAGYPKLIAQHKGKVVLADFWATWCVPCRKQLPDTVKLEAKLRARGLDVLMISTDEVKNEPAAMKVLKESKMAAPGFLRVTKDEDEFCHKVDPKWEGAMPATFLYDRNGKLVKSFIGETPLETIEAAILKLL